MGLARARECVVFVVLPFGLSSAGGKWNRFRGLGRPCAE